MIGEPGRDYLWILARTPTLPDHQYRALVEAAREQGFPVKDIKRNRDPRPEGDSPPRTGSTDEEH